MSTGFVPSSVSTVCVTRQPWQQRSRGISVLAGERAQGFGLHASSGIGGSCCSSTARCCARICPGFRRSEDLGRRGAWPVVLTPDEVVRILGFLEGEHRLFAQLLYGTGMRIARVCNCGSRIWISITARSSCGGGQGLQGSAFTATRELAPSLREQLSRCTGMVALKDRAEGRSGVALPDALERKYPRAGHSWPWFWVFAQHTHSTDPRSRCRASPSHV